MITEEQRENRKLGIGGSDAAAVLGVSRYKTPLDVYREKNEGYQVEENDNMRIGNILEPFIVEAAKAIISCDNIESIDTVFSEEHPWMMANVDGVIQNSDGSKSILECKTASFFSFIKQFGEECTDQMPTEYLIQCAHYCCVLDVDECHLVVFVKPDDESFSNSVLSGKVNSVDDLYLSGGFFKKYTYKRNERLENKMTSIESNFWFNNVEAEVPPDPSNTKDLLSLDIQGEEQIIADDELKKLIECKIEFSQKKKEAEKKEKEINNLIISKAKSTGTIFDEKGKKLCRIQKKTRKSFDSSRFRERFELIYDEYLKESSYIEIRGMS